MGDLEMALAAIGLAGMGTPSVEQQFMDAGIIDQYGQVITDPYKMYGNASGATIRPDGPPKSSAKMGRRKVADAGKSALASALGLVDNLTTPSAKAMQSGATKLLGTGVSTGAGPMAAITRFAASPAALTAAKVGTGIGALGGVLGVADVLAGNDSVGNKLMDTAAMGIGGTLGAIGGPVGIAAGAGLGKAASDATQWLFGDKKSAEQRKMEEALAALRGGQI